jgi:hypothetical protein
MEQLIPIIIQLIGGGAGGNVVAAVLKNLPLSKIVATIAGIIGGVGGGQLASSGMLEAVMSVLGGGESIGAQGASSAAGGALLTLIVGFIQKAMAPKA